MANTTPPEPEATTTTTTSSSSTVVQKGVAGRINYAQWDKVASDLVQQSELEDEQATAEATSQLGLDGKYARSQAQADEHTKALQVQHVKQTLDRYQEREQAIVQTMTHLFTDNSPNKQTVRVTRQDMAAGTRVLRITDTQGTSIQDSTVVVTQDLSHLESQMPANSTLTPKSYAGDAENDLPTETAKTRSIFGLIKIFLHKVSNCTVWIKSKVISGTLELHHCDNVVVKIVGPHATIATVQMDLSRNVTVEFHNAPSGHNTATSPDSSQYLYWGHSVDDRIFHAGVSNLTVSVHRDSVVEYQTTADYLADGATAVGNATPEEQQFVTSVHNQALVTERVVRTGSTTGNQVRAMTERELQAAEVKKQQAADKAIAMAQDMIQLQDKDGNPLVTKTNTNNTTTATNKEEEEVQEVVSPHVQAIVDECQQNKTRGNEAFGAGEYGQAILLYSLALDKADELGDSSSSLFPRDVVYANRAACFLKLGQPEKAEQDAQQALAMNPDNLKALFRRGLALHAQQQYSQALPYLAQASKQEPNNKQIQQALKFCEVRLEQDYRKRQMAGH